MTICAVSWNQIQKITVEEAVKMVVEYSLKWKQLKCVTTGGAGACVRGSGSGSGSTTGLIEQLCSVSETAGCSCK